MARRLYPPTPRGITLDWEGGRWQALIRDQDGNYQNLAAENARTKRDAILCARASLGLPYTKYL
ncbi:MAG: hypothetical protein A2Y38_15205 [Spirochaetes bacterium GWB1_59_5]|nr:MAG: hypothetical protein A2Y38_15205 [Spirochaetes bacterium GWB1_59_5]